MGLKKRALPGSSRLSRSRLGFDLEIFRALLRGRLIWQSLDAWNGCHGSGLHRRLMIRRKQNRRCREFPIEFEFESNSELFRRVKKLFYKRWRHGGKIDYRTWSKLTLRPRDLGPGWGSSGLPSWLKPRRPRFNPYTFQMLIKRTCISKIWTKSAHSEKQGSTKMGSSRIVDFAHCRF